MDNAVAVAAIALTGTIATGFFALIRQQNRVHERLANSGEAQAKATREGFKSLTTEAKRGNDESKERNGHLGELIIQQGEQIQSLATTATTQVIEAVQNVKEQHIEHAHIEHEEVKKVVKVIKK